MNNALPPGSVNAAERDNLSCPDKTILKRNGKRNRTCRSPRDTDDEVNDYLGRAIDARSIDRLRSEHCKRFLLTFRDTTVEAKFSKEKDKVLQAYFTCSLIIFLAVFELQRNVLPR